MTLVEKVQSLIDSANEVTGESDEDLTSAVQTLVDGFGDSSIWANHNDSTTETPNTYINIDSGECLPYNDWSSTDYIEIPTGATHIVTLHTPSGMYGYNAFYDESKQKCGSNSSGVLMQIPTGSKYFRDSSPSNDVKIVGFIII